jgi:hypothetical protein
LAAAVETISRQTFGIDATGSTLPGPPPLALRMPLENQ